MRYFYIIFTLFHFSNQAQISEVYSVNLEQNIKCNVSFFEDSTYIICINEQMSSDIIESLVFSYGKYLIKDNRLELADLIYNYTMEAFIVMKVLTFKKSFGFLKSHCFFFLSENHKKSIDFNFDVNSQRLYNERQEYRRETDGVYPLIVGNYVNLNSFGMKIELQNLNRYKIEYKNVQLSMGKVTKLGNELIFFDTDLKYPFYALMGEKCIISKLLPGDLHSQQFDKN